MKTRLLLYVTKPLIVFKPVKPGILPGVWSEGRYLVEMFVFGFIPFGKQWIVITKDENKYQIRDNGYGNLIRTWDHLISMQPTQDNKTYYSDEVTIHAGFWTPFITLYALFFYWWRQKRWKKLAANQFRCFSCLNFFYQLLGIYLYISQYCDIYFTRQWE